MGLSTSSPEASSSTTHSGSTTGRLRCWGLLSLFNVGIILTLLAVWLGYQEYRLNQDHGNHGSCSKLKLGEEDPAWEAKVKEALPAMERAVAHFMDLRAEGKLDDPNPKGRWKRAQHPVAWGCIKDASLEILPSIDPALKHGLFAQSGKHRALVRFSKGSFEPDFAPKITSVALKVFGVKGKRADLRDRDQKISDANKDTQDFITITNPTLPLAAVPEEFTLLHEYLSKAIYPGAFFWLLLNRPTLIPRIGALFLRGWRVNNPLLSTHFTVAPNRVGEDGIAAKFALVPCESGNDSFFGGKQLKWTYIHEIIQDYLNRHEGCMKLMLQRQTDPCADRVDDFLHAWSGPWEHVGTLRIPKGAQLDRGDDCDNTAFNPFHAVEANRPLGWVQRVRKEVYAMGSARRIEKNPAAAVERQ